MDIHKLIRSFGYAWEGIAAACREQNLRLHIFSAVIAVLAGILTGLSAVEWLFIITAIVFVIGAEMLNTAIERVVDLASPGLHPLAKQAKDIAAGAVLVFAAGSAVIGCIIFLPKWIGYF